MPDVRDSPSGKTPSLRRQPSSNDEDSSTDEDPLQDYAIIDPRYPTVVRINGKLVAVACFVGECKANAIENRGRKSRFFQGLVGLRVHVRQAHPEVGDPEIEELAKVCSKQKISDIDTESILCGRDPKMEIKMVSSGRSEQEVDR